MPKTNQPTGAPSQVSGAAQAAGVLWFDADHPENIVETPDAQNESETAPAAQTGTLGPEWDMPAHINNALIGLARGTHKVVFGKTITFVPVDTTEGAAP